jgi:hypothetical protein
MTRSQRTDIFLPARFGRRKERELTATQSTSSPVFIMAASIEADVYSLATVELDESDDDDSYNLPNFMPPTRVIMNRNNRKDLSGATEARIFRELFGTRLVVVEILWFLLDDLSLHPEKHLLWALHFMKAYPLQFRGVQQLAGPV